MSLRNGDAVAEKIKRHDKYYLNGGDIVFLVENYLFRVHKYFFERESPVFRERLALATPAGQSARGQTDLNPFPLDDVSGLEFSRFLWVFYNPLYSLYSATVEEWSSILKLSYIWRFTEVKNLVVRELEKQYIAPIPKIALYQKYDVDRGLLLQSYAYLTMRDEPLSMAEGVELGLETCLLLAQARERARGSMSPTGNRASSPVNADDSEVGILLREVFSLKDMFSPSLKPITPESPIDSADDVPLSGGMPNGTSIQARLFGNSTPTTGSPSSSPIPSAPNGAAVASPFMRNGSGSATQLFQSNPKTPTGGSVLFP
ncbi:hypothetical protein JAAARDRAFT_141165 [Jaapia argillacea MUCL 33604]|uniref:BTB domain-containing protein n=1 Tax=Jaapia argillacea MUCL 33604 TaxID=933084 RepID=A0A067P7Y1_9AGAM|nr:hypothetical protein JAAARDRAFT_141165 [Jaapia argillacea MUCL 33604]